MTGKELFSSTAFECSRIIANRYSTSFSIGIKMLPQEMQGPIYGIYGFVRCADEIVDTFFDYNREELFHRFKQDTFNAIDEEVSFNPVLQAFQEVVHQYGIERHLIEAFLESMEMDIHRSTYERDAYQRYIYGSAEVVGLMCLRVFCNGNNEKYQNLEMPARRLGAAFQKVNFLRDLREDYYHRGRSYFPGFLITNFSKEHKATIEEEIEADFNAAYKGVLQLSEHARFGVYVAYMYYFKLFNKIRQSAPTVLLTKRLRLPNVVKFNLLVSSYFRDKLNIL